MVEIDIVYEGELRCEATHAPSGQSLRTDAPVDNHGKGEFFSPTDLVATAIGTCMVTIMGIAAQKKGFDIDGTRVHVKKIMSAEGRRRIARLEVEFRFPRAYGDRQRKLLQHAAETCPVFASLRPETEIPISYHFPEE